jgi:hypothetical protein
MLGRIDRFITQHDTTEETRAKQHKENQERLAASQGKMNLIIALLMLLIALLSAGPAIRTLFKSSVDFLPDVFRARQVQAMTIESAHLPSTR